MDREFLKLCGFEGKDFDIEGPRVERAFNILEIGPEDVNRGKATLKKYYSIELEGVRKFWGIALKELADLILAKEEGKKVIYGSYPPLSTLIAAAALAQDDIYCSPPEGVLSNVVASLFGQEKIDPILEVAENHGLALNFNSCSYLKLRLGGIISKKIPMPDLLFSFCFLCDQTPKTDEILNEMYGIPIAYVDNIFEEKGEGWPQDISPRCVKYFADEIKACAEKFSEVIGYELTEEAVIEANKRRVKNFATFDKIYEFAKADPMPLSQNDSMKIAQIVYSSVGRGLKEGADAFKILYKELEQRVKDGVGVTEKGAPRLFLFMGPFDPSIVSVIEKFGLAIPVTTLAGTPNAGAPSSYSSVWEQTADALMRRRGCYHSSWAEVRQVKELCQLWNVDGAIIYVHTSCRQQLLYPMKERMVIEEELGIPAIIVEGDWVDSRNYNEEQFRTRMETFAEVVKTNKAAKKR